MSGKYFINFIEKINLFCGAPDRGHHRVNKVFSFIKIYTKQRSFPRSRIRNTKSGRGSCVPNGKS